MSDDSIVLRLAREHSAAFEAAGASKSQWDFFEYSVKLALTRWTALRMAMEGEWGGGDMRRKYEILLEDVLYVFKYNKTVYGDDLALDIAEYVESEFGLICEDGSVEEVAALMVLLADECKQGKYDRVKTMHDQVQSLLPIDLKKAKVRRGEGGVMTVGGVGPDASAGAYGGDAAMQGDGSAMETVQEEENLVDEDGFTTVRRSGRRKAAPKFYDPSIEFPGAQ